MKKLIALLTGLFVGLPSYAEDNLTDVFTALDAVLEVKNPELSASFREPLSQAQIAALELEHQVTLPDAVRNLYLWHDGQSQSGFVTFVDNMQFLPLADMLATKADFDGMIGYDFVQENWWHPAWLPILGNGGGDYNVVDMEGVHSGNANQVVTFYHDWDYRPIVSKDLDKLLQAALAYYQATPVDEMDEFHRLDDFLPSEGASFTASGKASPLSSN